MLCLILAFSKVTYQFSLGYLQGTGKEKYILACALVSTVLTSVAVTVSGELFALPGVYLVMIGKYFIFSLIFIRKIRSLSDHL